MSGEIGQQPKFEHDCDNCRFIARSSVVSHPGADPGSTSDLYICLQRYEDPTEHRGFRYTGSLIIRFSDEPSDNASYPILWKEEIPTIPERR